MNDIEGQENTLTLMTSGIFEMLWKQAVSQLKLVEELLPLVSSNISPESTILFSKIYEILKGGNIILGSLSNNLPRLLITRSGDNFGLILRRALLTVGWTQSHLAKAIGVSQGRVSNWINGERPRDPAVEDLIIQTLENKHPGVWEFVRKQTLL